MSSAAACSPCRRRSNSSARCAAIMTRSSSSAIWSAFSPRLPLVSAISSISMSIRPARQDYILLPKRGPSSAPARPSSAARKALHRS
ncbi:hypothetical protein VW35_17580 [Devosia soli]|uniref:Uncharacterized protein n=1 Tax=Devosia soli TaxID=361041 RepID=A0A0F5L4N8_9HYPH|nr:hypothetical protein VW35_17580 [Devosia soli]